MGRPQRRDADYFPFYAKEGRTLFILESKYQCKGTGFFTNVMRLLTMTPDHHICISEESDRLYFYSRVKCDEVSGADMLQMMAKTEKIDPELWEKYQLIVSQDLLDSLADAYRKRNNNIITIDEIGILYAGKEDSGGGNGESSGGNPQTKLKESKVKKKQAEPEKGKHFSVFVSSYLNEILKECHRIDQLPQKRSRFNPYQWVQFHTKEKKHPQAMLESLQALVKYWKDTKNPWSYADKIILTKSGNYNEEDHHKQSEEFKKDLESVNLIELTKDLFKL